MDNKKVSSQPQLIDSLLEIMKKDGKLSSKSLSSVIEKLKKAKKDAINRERREQETQRRQQEEQRRIQKRQEEAAHIRQVTSMDLPMDWENAFAGDSRVEGVHADSIPDGLILSLSNLGRVDMEYISSVTGEDLKTVIRTLKGSVYQNPDTWDECFYKGWETAEQYLSGNMVQKWHKAKKANMKYAGYFAENVAAIEKVMPPTLSSDDIYITLGSPWVPEDIIDDFIRHIMGTHDNHNYTTHDPYTGSWDIDCKGVYSGFVAAYSTYGTSRISALYILERTLNMKTVKVTDEVICHTNKSGKKRVINQTETVAALEKQQKLIREFQDWVWKDPARKSRLETIFENKYSCMRKRHFDGSFLTFPTMSPDITLYPYQKDAVARILFSPNTLLAHDVGSGKTFVMIAAGMEMRRMGMSTKNLYVVPNNLVGQWRDMFLRLYPHANLLCVEPKHFTPKKRESVLESIRDNDYDGIIMAHSSFELVSLSREHYINELKAAKERIENIRRSAKRTTSRLRRKADAVETELAKAITRVLDKETCVFFDELGITRLFVDEAHNYKNVPVDTQLGNVLGISTTGSQKCQDMMDKVHLVQKNNGGGGVVFATGTPITNSITDAFIMQKYLQSGELAMLDLQSFDSWIGMFAEKVTEFEIDVDTSNYRLATRFSKFHNLPELTTLLASIADFHQVDTTDGVPETNGYTDALIGKTPEFDSYLKTISTRAEKVRAHYVSRKEDNMLKITTDGRKAALDLRLVEPRSKFTYQSKLARCAENVWDIYKRTAAKKSTQLIFCDTSTPKKGFNMYEEMRSLLFAMGIPAEQIAFIHDADTERRRKALFSKVQAGDIRVLIGSTFKLGTGVNVQNKLIAIHHLDVPWRPADMTQREGRILRQGNENETVKIFRYITEGSFDAYSWQLLETKQRFIVGLLSGSIEERSGSDIEGTVLDYAEVKALAVGNPLIKERVETANELTRLLTLQRKAIESRIQMEKNLAELPGKMDRQKNLIEKCKEDTAFMQETFATQDKETRRQIRKTIFDAVTANEMATKETVLLTYQGFSLILPSNMTMKKPYMWLQRQGRYYVELGDSEVGCLIRLDNALEGLPEHLQKLENNLAVMEQQALDIQSELDKKEDHSDAIRACKAKLLELDRQLGVAAA